MKLKSLMNVMGVTQKVVVLNIKNGGQLWSGTWDTWHEIGTEYDNRTVQYVTSPSDYIEIWVK